jgi:ATP-dependent helicase HrpB
LSDAVLAATAGDVAGAAPLSASPALGGDRRPMMLAHALHGLLPWEMAAPAGGRGADAFCRAARHGASRSTTKREGGPVLSVRVQELYGLAVHPALAGGRVALTLELLSPAHRPIQITRDLPGFWRGSWAQVRTEMKGRYPRHVWPDDPAAAQATTRAKPRGT